MKIFVTMKSLAKRKNYLTKIETHLSRNPKTLRELLKELVAMEVQQFNKKQTEEKLTAFLTNEDMELQAEAGKVGFSNIYIDQKANLHTAIQNSIQAFEDGLVKVFHNEKEQTALDAALDIQEGDQFTFIKLMMLAGRMW